MQVGAHACTQCQAHITDPAWDPTLLLDHVAATGIQLNFISNSYYDFGPGENGTLDTFDAEMLELIEHALALGLTNVQFGIDEVKI